MYYVARWYDSEIGHFIQADTIVPGAGNPLAWNRYAYVKYNPILYIDPSGHTLFPPNRNLRMTDGGWGEQYRNYSPDDASSKAQSSTGTQVRDFVLEKVEESGRYNKNTDEDNWKKADYCTVFVLWVATALDGGGWDSGLADSTITFADQTPYNLTTLFLDYMSDRPDVSVSDNIDMPSSEQLENPDIARDFASNFRKGDIVLINQPDVWGGNLNHAYMVVAVDYQSGNVSVADYLQPDVNNFKDFNDVTYPIESFAVIRIDEFYFGGN